MKKTISWICVLATALFAQVVTINKAGTWGVLYPSDPVVKASFFSPILTGNVGRDVLYGRFAAGSEPKYLYFWTTEGARDGGDTTAAIAGAIGGCLASTGNCTVTLTPRNSSGTTITMQYDKSQALNEGIDIDIGPLNVSYSQVQDAVNEILSGSPQITSPTIYTSQTLNYATASRPAWIDGSKHLRSTSVTGSLDTIVTNVNPRIYGGTIKGRIFIDTAVISTVQAGDTSTHCGNCSFDTASVGLLNNTNIAPGATSGLWFGEEYLYVFRKKFWQGDALHVVLAGDSETNGDGIEEQKFKPQYALAQALDAAGVPASVSRMSVAGSSAKDWVLDTLPGQLATHPNTIIIQFGQNPAGTPDSTQYWMDQGLATIRTGSRTMDSLTCILRMPNAVKGDSTRFLNQEVWMRSLARKYQCAFFDTWTMLRDMEHSDSLLDAFNVHPRSTMGSMINAAFVNTLIPPAFKQMAGSTYSVNTNSAVHPSFNPPLDTNGFYYPVYPMGWSMNRAPYTDGNGWPFAGTALTFHSVDSNFFQILFGPGHNTTPMRIGGKGNSWGDFFTPISANDTGLMTQIGSGRLTIPQPANVIGDLGVAGRVTAQEGWFGRPGFGAATPVRAIGGSDNNTGAALGDLGTNKGTVDLIASDGSVQGRVHLDSVGTGGGSLISIAVRDPINNLVDVFSVRGNGEVKASGSLVATRSGGTFTVTATGMTASVTGTATYEKIGNLVGIRIPALSGTSNFGELTVTGIPSGLWPTIDVNTANIIYVTDNGNNFIGAAAMSSSDGHIQLYKAPVNLTTQGIDITSSFAGSGNKGMSMLFFLYLAN